MIIEYGHRGVARPWLVRTSRALASTFFAAAAAAQLVLTRVFADYPAWLPGSRIDESVLFWAVFPAFMGAIYALLIVLPQQMKASYLIPPSVLVALIVCGFVGLVAWGYASPSAHWYQYLIVLGSAAVLSLVYVAAMVKRSPFDSRRSRGAG